MGLTVQAQPKRLVQKAICAFEIFMSVYKAMLITLMAAYGKASVRYKEGTQVRGCREEVGVSFTVVNVKVKMRKK
jgi:hypothetical protein